jgi:TetR/AcrR family transcriptional regulator, transcriptional repressor for nem operon
MVKSKQFDKHVALDEAMDLFWERGYHATSIQDLVDRLGVNRQSLYDTYGGKEQLFLSALERYRELQGAPLRRTLEREGPARVVLRQFFEEMIENLTGGECKGCFMANTTTGLAGQDESIFNICAANHRQLEAAFSGLLLRAQQNGEIAADRALLPMARFLVNTINGLGVTAKATRDKKVLEEIVDVALGGLAL